VNWEGLPRPHRAALMEGPVWHSPRYQRVLRRRGIDQEGFTAMSLRTGEIGFAGPAETFVLGYKDTEANRMRLALHMLSCKCGWSHVL